MGEQGANVMRDFGRKGLVVVIGMMCLFSFLTGAVAAQRNVVGAIFEKSELEWAQEKGLFDETVKDDAFPTQAVFLTAVMKVYGDTKAHEGYTFNKIKGHPAADIYSAGKANGLIPCSCVIKPDQPMTLREAADFIMRGINRKSGEVMVGIQDVTAWAGRSDGDEERNITYKESSLLLRKMEEIFTQRNLIKKEVDVHGEKVGD